MLSSDIACCHKNCPRPASGRSGSARNLFLVLHGRGSDWLRQLVNEPLNPLCLADGPLGCKDQSRMRQWLWRSRVAGCQAISDMQMCLKIESRLRVAQTRNAGNYHGQIGG